MLAAPPGTPTMFEVMAPSMTKVDSMRAKLVSASRASNPATTANAFHELMVTDLRPELPKITAPMVVLYVVPPNSPLPAAQFDTAIRTAFGGATTAQIIKIENSLHFIQFDQPGRLVAEVDALMRR